MRDRDTYLTFDDVLIRPDFSNLESRFEADTSTEIGELRLKVPILLSNMESISNKESILQASAAGGGGFVHRYQNSENIKKELEFLKENHAMRVPSIGVQKKELDTAKEYLNLGVTAICVDVAHGHSRITGEMVSALKKIGYRTVIAGNVATDAGARYLESCGADAVKVGIGPGSICSTRTVTGCGVPQLSAILDVANSGLKCSIIADGGMASSGDIVKALAAGADAVMSGFLFAGHFPTPSYNKNVYRGMASKDAQMDWRGRVGNGTPEGVAHAVSRMEGSVYDVVESLDGGIRSGMSYVGARNLQELRSKAVFIRVSTNTLLENATRAKK